MPKFTSAQRQLIKNIVSMYSIKRIDDSEILEEIYQRTGKRLVQKSLFYLRRRIKQDSYEWYERMRKDQFEYIHEFKERINEILDLQKRHYEIVDSSNISVAVKQTSLIELHKLSVTLSNLFDVAPFIVGVGKEYIGNAISNATKNKTPSTEREQDIIV